METPLVTPPITAEMFEGIDFNSIMVSCNGKRLWVTYRDGYTLFKVETLKDGKATEFKYIEDAIKAYNEL